MSHVKPACELGGDEFPCEVTLQSVQLGERSLLLAELHDLTERKRNEDRLFQYQLNLEDADATLKENSVTDQLTRVLNRKAFEERLREEFDRSGYDGYDPMQVECIHRRKRPPTAALRNGEIKIANAESNQHLKAAEPAKLAWRDSS